MTAELERLPFTSARAWRAWLEANHDTSPGIWLMIAKKGSGVESVTYDEAVDESLCFGWIDGQKAKLDDQYYLQRSTRHPQLPASSPNSTAPTVTPSSTESARSRERRQEQRRSPVSSPISSAARPRIPANRSRRRERAIGAPMRDGAGSRLSTVR